MIVLLRGHRDSRAPPRKHRDLHMTARATTRPNHRRLQVRGLNVFAAHIFYPGHTCLLRPHTSGHLCLVRLCAAPPPPLNVAVSTPSAPTGKWHGDESSCPRRCRRNRSTERTTFAGYRINNYGWTLRYVLRFTWREAPREILAVTSETACGAQKNEGRTPVFGGGAQSSCAHVLGRTHKTHLVHELVGNLGENTSGFASICAKHVLRR